MARTRRLIAARFLRKFEKDRAIHDMAAQQATELLKEVLVNSPALIHVVAARCKKPDSLWLKLCEKRYGQPKRQLTDLVAARIITYYQKDVPIIVRTLNHAVEVDPHKSVDKRVELEAGEFGYTSVHLIARTKGSWATSPKYHALRDRWFEIQVRSILEHAWAEIEHEVVYKSGIKYPPSIKRRFARMAGAIEILEDEFEALRVYQEGLIDLHKQRYAKGEDGAAELDSVRLIALLECVRPDSLGWRAAESAGAPFPPHIANTCIKALKRTGIKTGKALRAAVQSKDMRSAEAIFAREYRMSQPASHLNTARLAVLLKSRTIFADYFPELASDPAIEKVLQMQKKRRAA
jgi:ppGpp synthetase/RelA/SpoT-type nucleotidyltranferase